MSLSDRLFTNLLFVVFCSFLPLLSAVYIIEIALNFNVKFVILFFTLIHSLMSLYFIRSYLTLRLIKKNLPPKDLENIFYNRGIHLISSYSFLGTGVVLYFLLHGYLDKKSSPDLDLSIFMPVFELFLAIWIFFHLFYAADITFPEDGTINNTHIEYYSLFLFFTAILLAVYPILYIFI